MSRLAWLAIAFLSVIPGCRWGTMTQKAFEERYGPIPVPQPESAGPSGPLPGSSVPELPPDKLFEGVNAQALIARFRDRLGGGPIRAHSLVIFDSYAILEAQDPRIPRNMDQYVYRDHRIEEPTPVRIADRTRMDEELFTDEVPLGLVPDLVPRALSDLAIPDAKPTHVYVEKVTWGPSPRIVLRVYASSPREGGYVEFSTSGEQVRVSK